MGLWGGYGAMGLWGYGGSFTIFGFFLGLAEILRTLKRIRLENTRERRRRQTAAAGTDIFMLVGDSAKKIEHFERIWGNLGIEKQ